MERSLISNRPILRLDFPLKTRIFPMGPGVPGVLVINPELCKNFPAKINFTFLSNLAFIGEAISQRENIFIFTLGNALFYVYLAR